MIKKVRHAIKRMSNEDTVRMFPKRYPIRSDAYPGVMNTNMIPTAIPKDQTIPISESFRKPDFLDSASIPIAENVEKTAAPKIGLIPRKYPIPIPPKEA